MASVIVVGNEKGGAGKSTIAVHVVAGLLYGGASVAVIDLDLRQASSAHFFENRRTWANANNATIPHPKLFRVSADDVALAEAAVDAQVAAFEEAFAKASESDFVLIDTPGGHTPLMRLAHGRADLVVTPLNDSFVDFDMLGVIDPVSLELKRPSLYALTVWEARKTRAQNEGKSLEWVVLRNRLGVAEARNGKRIDERLKALSKRTGFHVGPGLRDRVIYRELFPFGLTAADLSPKVRPIPVSLTHVAARQELRGLMHAIGLSAYSGEELLAAE